MNSPIMLWRKQQFDRQYLNVTGIVLTWTQISVGPVQFAKQTPYTVVLVELKSGERIYGQMVSSQELVKIGSKVRSTLRRIGDADSSSIIAYGIKFMIEL